MTDLQSKADRVSANSENREHFEFHMDINKVSPDIPQSLTTAQFIAEELSDVLTSFINDES